MGTKEILADGVEIWLGDFRDEMPHIGVVDHIICDPPYEQISHDASGSIRRADGISNPVPIPFAGIDDIRSDIVRSTRLLCSGWALYFCTTEGVALWRDEIERHDLKYKTPCLWVKPDSMPRFNGQGPSHGHECIVTAWCAPGYSTWNGGGRRGTFIHNCNPPTRHGTHPTEKPVSLMTELVQLFTNPGQIVCDPFMGSGSTGIACVRTGRKFIGIEVNPEYYAIAKSRILDELSRPTFFQEYPERMKQARLELK